ncbi:MAG: hypothetical protein IT307_13255 [Chloroflexi bacterium]|nr:hypothetical protein [Chloroflexota bacterium]
MGCDIRFNRNLLADEAAAALQLLQARIDFFNMEMQDAVDFSRFLVEATMTMQRFSDGILASPSGWIGTGGQIDVAVITDGHSRFLRAKELRA